jgi:hypothetical protein
LISDAPNARSIGQGEDQRVDDATRELETTFDDVIGARVVMLHVHSQTQDARRFAFKRIAEGFCGSTFGGTQAVQH